MKDRTTVALRLEADCLFELLRAGCLAASSMAHIVADPYAYGAMMRTAHGARFTFSDIPDLHFREPREIISMSHIEGGSES